MNDHDPSLTEDEQALLSQLQMLRQEHADLEASIEALGQMPIPDQLLIARLKRKKLALRDEIVKIEDAILPDIIA
ncbi:YdcH family protein [Brevundimonas vesicularis]|uniref:YdcH family protein n=1 Tax=Brevundimonas vesicularis TaxID=41276 RepID=UPI0038D4A559